MGIVEARVSRMHCVVALGALCLTTATMAGPASTALAHGSSTIADESFMIEPATQEGTSSYGPFVREALPTSLPAVLQYAPEDVRAASLVYDVDASTASEILHTQSRMEIADRILTLQYPDWYGGMWFDTQSLAVIATTTPGAPVHDVSDTVLELFPGTSAPTLKEVGRSLAELNDQRDAITNDMIALYERGALATSNMAAWNVDVVANRVAVALYDDNPIAASVVRTLYGDVHVYSAMPAGDDAVARSLGCQTYRTRCNPLRGGTPIHTFNAGENTGCSIGFSATTLQGGYMVTAAHCRDTYSRHGNEFVGFQDMQWNGGSVDVQRHPVSTSATYGWYPLGYYAIHGSGEAYQLQHRYTGNSRQPGTMMCMSGRTRSATTENCSTVMNGSWSGMVESEGMVRLYTNMLQSRYTSSGGDSGGTVYAAGVLFGVHKGSADGGAIASYLANAEMALGGIQAVTKF